MQGERRQKMTNKEAGIIVGNIPIDGDDCYSIPEYQQAKAIAIDALKTVERIKARKRELEKKLQGSFSLSEATEHYALVKLLTEAENADSD
jgi:hypothetical protein